MRITHVFIVALCADARKNIKLGGKYRDLPVTVVADFDYRGKSRGDLEALVDYDAFLRKYWAQPSPGEIGCAAAHLHCWRRLLELGGEAALIFEDDVTLEDSAGDFLSDVEPKLALYDLIHLKLTCGTRRKTLPLAGNSDVVEPTVYTPCTAAYVIRSDLAERFVSRQVPKITSLSDWPLEIFSFRCIGYLRSPVAFVERASTLSRASTKVPASRFRWDFVIYRVRLLAFRVYRRYRLSVCGDLPFP